MAIINKKVLDYSGLQKYDSRIKALLPVFDGETITQNERGEWQANSATSTEVDADNELLTIFNLQATPGVAGEVMTL